MVSIPDSVQNNELEDKVLTISKKIDTEVSSSDIEACHRLHKEQETFSPHKDCDNVREKKT